MHVYVNVKESVCEMEAKKPGTMSEKVIAQKVCKNF